MKEKKRTLVLGDIHGGFKALEQCFERSSYDPNKDRLIVLGDIVDGWPETKQCIERLWDIEDLIYILGNHDVWALDWMLYGSRPNIWISQGGIETIESFGGLGEVCRDHVRFLQKGLLYYIQDNKLFVHGGIDVNQQDIRKQRRDTLLWDRQLIQTAWRKSKLKGNKWKVKQFDEVFIGHTTTSLFKRTFDPIIEPIHACNVWDLDTGGGWEGKLTIMDVDTKEYWQSDFVYELYPECRGRRG